jgi:hypothetical protein
MARSNEDDGRIKIINYIMVFAYILLALLYFKLGNLNFLFIIDKYLIYNIIGGIYFVIGVFYFFKYKLLLSILENKISRNEK